MGRAGKAGVKAVQGAQYLDRLFGAFHLGVHQAGLECADIARNVARTAVPGGRHDALVILDAPVLDPDPVAQRAPRRFGCAHALGLFRPGGRVPLLDVGGGGVTGLTAAGAAVSDPRFVVMAIVMAAGMTPPLGLALATVLRKKMFSNAERQNGKAAWLLGASFITEGAIPFAAADPIRVIPSIMIGSGVSGALVAAFGCTLRAPHGGLWVFGLVGNWPMYLIAVAIGTVVTALLVIVAKNIKPGVSDEELEEAVA